MLQLDDVQLYDLSETGPLLFSDPARLTRLARSRQLPAARVPSGEAGVKIGFPVPWVEAACGRSGADPDSLRRYWLERLAPPAADARRPKRPRKALPSEDLLTPEAAARRLHASAPALCRLTADGTLPALRVEGAVRYDAQLVDLLASEELPQKAADRRALVSSWARFEYETLPQPSPEAAPPAAYEIPEELLSGPLIEAEGFETIDED